MPGDELWSTFSADPRDPGSAGLRANDRDRDHAIEILRDAFADGRLSRVEYDERTDAMLRMRTIGEIGAQLADLVPATQDVVRRSVTPHTRAVQRYERELRDARNGWVTVSFLTLVIWVATSFAAGGPYFFWPVFPIAGVGIGYVVTRINRESRIESIEDGLLERRRRRRDS